MRNYYIDPEDTIIDDYLDEETLEEKMEREEKEAEELGNQVFMYGIFKDMFKH